MSRPYIYMSNLTGALRIVLLVVSLVALVGCERDTRMTVSQDNPPKFYFTGNGRLGRFRVCGPKMRDADGEDQYVVWQIERKGGFGDFIEDVGPITYGRIPEGYKQIFPEEGSAPSIVEGENYYVRVDTNNANGTSKHFVLKQGKILSADLPYELEEKQTKGGQQ